MQTQKKTKKIYDGRFMLGTYTQWLLDEKKGLNRTAIDLALLIARQSFGYRKRYAYIHSDYFSMDKMTLKRYRDVLVQEGLLEWKKTKGYTMYKLLEPKNEIDSFVFSSKPIEEVITNPEDEENWNPFA